MEISNNENSKDNPASTHATRISKERQMSKVKKDFSDVSVDEISFNLNTKSVSSVDIKNESISESDINSNKLAMNASLKEPRVYTISLSEPKQCEKSKNASVSETKIKNVSVNDIKHSSKALNVALSESKRENDSLNDTILNKSKISKSISDAKSNNNSNIDTKRLANLKSVSVGDTSIEMNSISDTKQGITNENINLSEVILENSSMKETKKRTRLKSVSESDTKLLENSESDTKTRRKAKSVSESDTGSDENSKSDAKTRRKAKSVSKSDTGSEKKSKSDTKSRKKIKSESVGDTNSAENLQSDTPAERNGEVDSTKGEASQTRQIRKQILFVASEAQPFCATGGLADVCGSLPKAIMRASNDIEIRTILPLYSNISDKYRKDFVFIGYTYVTLSWRREYCGIFEYELDGVKYYFVDNEKYFKRDGGEYGYMDDGERFAYFSRAVLEVLPMINYFPDIIHANDWQSALVPVYLKTSNWDWRYDKIKTVLTIHNVQYQGRFGMQILTDVLGIDQRFAGLMTYDNDVNILKGAIVSADKITTVSPSYAEEIKTPEHGCGLHAIIAENAYKLCGILNGLDYDFYNPETDKDIYLNYSKDNLENKAKNKQLLQKEFGLEQKPDTPILAFCSRMNMHKGFDIIKCSIERLLGELDIQFVGVGAGDKDYMDFFRYLNNKYPGRVHISLGFSTLIGKKIYSGADIYVMPSISEPCGLSQLVASRYGVVPIVRETGGLKDTIKDFGCQGGGNGYTFASTNTGDFEYSVKRAVADFQNKDEWKDKMRKIMSQDFSWNKTAIKYVEIYNEL